MVQLDSNRGIQLPDSPLDLLAFFTLVVVPIHLCSGRLHASFSFTISHGRCWKNCSHSLLVPGPTHLSGGKIFCSYILFSYWFIIFYPNGDFQLKNHNGSTFFNSHCLFLLISFVFLYLPPFSFSFLSAFLFFFFFFFILALVFGDCIL